MDKDKKKIIAGGAVLVGTGIAVALLSRRGGAPPGEGYGKIWGYVKDSLTGERISGARVYIDDLLEFTSGINGEYSTGYYLFGEHCLVAEADNYETLTSTIVIGEESAKVEIRLDRLAEAPTQWTKDVVVREIRVEPTLAYVGETVEIKVYVEYPWPEFEGAHIDGEILIDGQVLKGSIDAPETIMRFQYPATLPGNYTILAQDKSAHFQIEQSVHGTFYSPWGNTRYPICTEMVIPDVNPFILRHGTEGRVYYEHPGGDLKLYPQGENRFSLAPKEDWLCGTSGAIKEVGSWDRVAEAYPSKWDPAEAVIREYKTEIKAPSFWPVRNCYYIIIEPTDYTCPPYWYSLEELAEALAKNLGTSRSSINALLQFHEVCGAGMCTPSVRCPYCDQKITGGPHTRGLAWDKVSFVRGVLSTIAKRHPEHPLTEPPR